MLRKVIKALGLLALACALLLAALQIANSGGGPVPPPPAGAIRIATHNVHYIDLTEPGGPWSEADWETRKDALDAAFKAMEADIVAFQEMESFRGGSDGGVNLAREFLLERNPGYAAAASGDWREFPSTQPIFYRTDRFRLVDQGWFFFSTTPDVIYSRTFNGSWPAFASWAEFAPMAGGPSLPRGERALRVSQREQQAPLRRARPRPDRAGDRGRNARLPRGRHQRPARSPTADRIDRGGDRLRAGRGIDLPLRPGAQPVLRHRPYRRDAGPCPRGRPRRAAGAVRGRMALRPLPGLRGLPAAALGSGGVQDAVGPVFRAGGRGRHLPALPRESEDRAAIDEVEPEAFGILADHRAGLGPRVEAIGEEVLEIPRRLEQDHLLGREPAQTEGHAEPGRPHVHVDPPVPHEGDGDALAPARGDARDREAAGVEDGVARGEEEEVERPGLLLEKPLERVRRHGVEFGALGDGIVAVRHRPLGFADRVVDALSDVRDAPPHGLRAFADLGRALPEEATEALRLRGSERDEQGAAATVSDGRRVGEEPPLSC